jgi:hypothetical protein
MNVSPDALRKELVALIRQINEQIEEIEKVAIERKIPIETIQDQQGNWVFPPLLLAKVQAYAALVQLQTKK